MKATWQPKRFSPAHYRVVYLYWSGVPGQAGPQATVTEIANYVGYSATHIQQILASDQAQEILQELHEKKLDTISDIEIAAQALAPEIFQEKVRLALRANDERVRNSACTDVLAIAGHQPVKRVSIERPDAVKERYGAMTDEELRKMIRDELGTAPVPAPSTDSVH